MKPVVNKDMKEALSSTRKPDLTYNRTAPMVYTARASEYGTLKYRRGNQFLGVSDGAATNSDFEKVNSYLRAAVSHTFKVIDPMEFHRVVDPDLRDQAGMMRAVYAVDTDIDTTGKVGPSFLPHIAGAIASLNMAIAIAVRAGLLPEDPGQPWGDKVCASMFAEEARSTRGDERAMKAEAKTPPVEEPVRPRDGCNCVICREKPGEVIP